MFRRSESSPRSLGLTALVYAPDRDRRRRPIRCRALSVILSVVGLGVLCTALAFLIFLALIAEAGPVRATVITYVNPAVAALLGVSILGEKITAGMGVGFVLVLAGCFLATAARGRSRSPEPARSPGRRRYTPDGTGA